MLNCSILKTVALAPRLGLGPNGQRLFWYVSLEDIDIDPLMLIGEPPVVDGDQLIAALSRVGVAALIARHAPVDKDARIHLVRALGGGLLRSGLSTEDVIRVITAVPTTRSVGQYLRVGRSAG